MLSSISPVGEHARGQRWGITVTAHVAAATAGGLLLGTAVGALGAGASRLLGTVPSPGTTTLVLLAAVAALAALLERGRTAVPVPTLHRQVDERWLDTYRGWVYGAGYGAQLGFGLVTIVPTWATPAMLLAMLLSGSPGDAAVIGGVYGLTRGLPVLATAGLRDPSRLWRFHERLERWDAPAGRATVAGLVLVALAGSVAVTGVGA